MRRIRAIPKKLTNLFKVNRVSHNGDYLKKTLLILVSLFLLVIAGCTGLQSLDKGAGQGQSYDRQTTGMMPSAIESFSAPSNDNGESISKEKVIVKEGGMRVKVQEGQLEGKLNDLKGILRNGDADTSSIVFNEYNDQKTYTITAKIAPTKFEATIEQIKKLGEVKSIDSSVEDVTGQYKDIELRIKNKRIELDRLYNLYNQSGKIDEIIQVEERITSVESEIERLEGQKQDLEVRSSKSTLRITLFEDKPVVQASLFSPLEQIGSTFFGALGVSILLLAGLVALLLPFLVVGWIIYKLYKKFKKTDNTQKKTVKEERK